MGQESYTRRDFLRAMAVGAVTFQACTGLSNVALGKPAVGKPNIIVILVDDLGYGDLSSYGARDIRTPNIDSLIGAGMRFDNFYANSPACSPTRASLLTGRYPDLVGVPGVIRTHTKNSWGYLSPQAVTIPRLLKEAGYHTGIVGKWHLGLTSPNTPNERGFNHFHGFLGDMMDDYYTHRRHGINYMRFSDKEIDPTGHATDLFTQWAIDYIRKQTKSKQRFFLYLAYNAPHTPIQPPEEYIERVKRREKDIDAKRAKLVALIEHLDDSIGKVMAALKAHSVYERTLIIFTSDNGGQLNVGANNGPLNGGKAMMYEGGIRVPMCVVWPDTIVAGSRSHRVALTMDLFPTICEAAGVRINHKIDGRSILPTLVGTEQEAEKRFLFWVLREGGRYWGHEYWGQDRYAVRYGDWKLLQNSPFEPLQLFNLKNDPGEQNPLDAKHKMYKQLLNAMQDHILETGAVPWQKHPVKLPTSG